VRALQARVLQAPEPVRQAPVQLEPVRQAPVQLEPVRQARRFSH
jgi:hypothetical protein